MSRSWKARRYRSITPRTTSVSDGRRGDSATGLAAAAAGGAPRAADAVDEVWVRGGGVIASGVITAGDGNTAGGADASVSEGDCGVGVGLGTGALARAVAADRA